MGSSLLTLTKGTWINPNNQQSHTSDNLLRTSITANQDTAVVQFTIPQNLRYKRFTNAVLIFYTTASAGGQDIGAGAKLTAYKTGDTLDQLVWSNMGALGEITDIVQAEPNTLAPSA